MMEEKRRELVGELGKIMSKMYLNPFDFVIRYLDDERILPDIEKSGLRLIKLDPAILYLEGIKRNEHLVISILNSFNDGEDYMEFMDYKIKEMLGPAKKPKLPMLEYTQLKKKTID